MLRSDSPVAATEVLDDAVDCVRTIAAPWVGVLWLGVLPLRLLTVHFVLELWAARDHLERLTSYLRGLAGLIVAAAVVASVTRTIFARCCHLGMAADAAPGREGFRLKPAEAAIGILSGLAALGGLHASWFLVVSLPILACLLGAGLANAHDASSPSVVALATRVVRDIGYGHTLGLVTAVLACALLVAMVGLAFGTSMVLWMLGGVFGLDLAAARAALMFPAPHATMLQAAVALGLVEPFWIATHVSFARRLRARESGEDLRGRLARLVDRRSAP